MVFGAACVARTVDGSALDVGAPLQQAEGAGHPPFHRGGVERRHPLPLRAEYDCSHDMSAVVKH